MLFLPARNLLASERQKLVSARLRHGRSAPSLLEQQKQYISKLSLLPASHYNQVLADSFSSLHTINTRLANSVSASPPSHVTSPKRVLPASLHPSTKRPQQCSWRALPCSKPRLMTHPMCYGGSTGCSSGCARSSPTIGRKTQHRSDWLTTSVSTPSLCSTCGGVSSSRCSTTARTRRRSTGTF